MCFEIVLFEAWYCPLLNKIDHFVKVHTPNIVTEHFPFKKDYCTFVMQIAPKLCSVSQCPRGFYRSANCHKSNEVSLNFLFFKSFPSIFQKSVRDSPKKTSVLILLQKRSSLQFFAEYFYKNIHNSRIKMLYQNRGHAFVF